MTPDNLKHPTDWFAVREHRSIDDPTGRVTRKEMVVSLDQYPHGFGLGPNPREPVLSSTVSKKIEATLQEDGENFHLKNRGVTIVAKGLDYDSRTKRARIHLSDVPDEERYFGILDGGNTDARIKQWREELPDDQREELARRFVNVQVLVPHIEGAPDFEMEQLLNDIKEARNTSVQVKTKSLADARRQFEAMKLALAGEPYFDKIVWHEGQPGSIDALQLVTFLMLFYPSFSRDAEGGEPSNAYGHKERCLDAFLQYAVKEPEELERWVKVLPEIVRLYDEIQTTFPNYYAGRFGRIKEVRIFDERGDRAAVGSGKKYASRPLHSLFMGQEMKYSYPWGWLFPILASFRVLAADTATGVTWKRDPVRFWHDNAGEIIKRFDAHLRDAGYAVKRVATSTIGYQAMRQAVTDLHKDDLLRTAGVTQV